MHAGNLSPNSVGRSFLLPIVVRKSSKPRFSFRHLIASPARWLILLSFPFPFSLTLSLTRRLSHSRGEETGCLSETCSRVVLFRSLQPGVGKERGEGMMIRVRSERNHLIRRKYKQEQQQQQEEHHPSLLMMLSLSSFSRFPCSWAHSAVVLAERGKVDSTLR